jgi:hypothetical protein
MRFMVIVKANEQSEAGALPSTDAMQKMLAFNEQLVKAGVMLSGEGLHSSSKGSRLQFAGERPTVIDGPFAETKELVGGFWIIQVKSKDEAIEWFSRAPFENGETLEIRQILDLEDFGESATCEVREQLDRIHAHPS